MYCRNGGGDNGDGNGEVNEDGKYMVSTARGF